MSRFSFAFTALVAVALSACAARYIPNTDVEDNDQNRRVIEFCEKYRKAVEMRNVPLLLKLADPKYYEDGGNADSTDDLDFQGLQAYLEDRFRESHGIRYEIRYRRVAMGRKETSLFVDYTYSASYKIPTPDGDLWRRRVADNRLEIVPEGESFRILSVCDGEARAARVRARGLVVGSRRAGARVRRAGPGRFASRFGRS